MYFVSAVMIMFKHFNVVFEIYFFKNGDFFSPGKLMLINNSETVILPAFL